MPSPTELIAAYTHGIALLQQAIAGLSREEMLARPIAGKWSILEVVAHIADFEPVYADRIKRIIALELPLLLVADENEFAKHLAYHERDIMEEIHLIAAIRTSVARTLTTLPASTWQKTGIHTVKGIVTLEAMVQSCANHISHHVPFILEKRKAMSK